MELESEAALLSAVIALIYDAAVDSSKWALALERACAFVGGTQAAMFWHGASPGTVEAFYLYNNDPHYLRLFFDTYAPLNPVFPKALFLNVGEVGTAMDLVPEDEMAETRFHKEWMTPQGITDALSVLLERDATGAAFLSMPWRGGPVDYDARQRMVLLAPHFQRAVSIGRIVAKHKANETALIDMLDQVSDAVVLLDSDGRPVFTNDAARRQIDENKLLRASGNLLRAVQPEADRALRDSLRAIARGEPIGRQGTTFALAHGSDARWIANLLPLRDGAWKSIGDANDAIAALFVRQSIAAAPTPLETMAKTYGLTASEIRVVAAMLQVSGRDAIAEALGISSATVKTHLSHIYRKCGAKNHGDLIKLVAGIRLAP